MRIDRRVLLSLLVLPAIGAFGGCGDGATAATASQGGGAPTSTSAGGSEGAGGATGSGGPSEPDPTPIGLDALSPHAFEQLPYLRLGDRPGHSSSFRRDGGNDDFGSVLRIDEHGDSVLLDQIGPGCIQRFWVTGFDPDKQRLKLYFDGEATPRIDATVRDFFGGKHAPFLAPLAVDDAVSSGGFISYLPFPYAKSVKVTATGNVPYYNIDHHTFEPGTSVQTWTGNEDTAAARALLGHAGLDPKVPHAPVEAAQSFDLAPGASTVLYEGDGPRVITAIELALPGVFPLASQPLSPAGDPLVPIVTDDGRAFQGSSEFAVALDPANHGVMLLRRMDYGIADQVAKVSVDGQSAGTWSTPGADAAGRWRDAGFLLPAALTQGKAHVTVKVTFAGIALDWNEFHYWIDSLTDAGARRTDEIDVGNAASEQAHGYVVAQPTFAGVQSFDYPLPQDLAAALASLRLAISWDGEATPSVDAPMGPLFGVGAFGPGLGGGLGAGLRADGTFYLYFPMPFAHHARIVLTNSGASAATRLRASVRHEAFTTSFERAGTFAVAYHEGPSKPGRDLPFLDTAGSGQIVGVVESVRGPRERGYLEGDERAHVDGARSPSIQGTGTEDFYNGGWYFDHGPMGLATQGESVFALVPGGPGLVAETAMYRQFIGDPLPFRSGIRLTIEHGGVDEVPVDAWMLVHYYRQAKARLTLTDTLLVGDAQSAADHGCTVSGATWSGTDTSQFEGDDDDVSVTASGRAHKGVSRFTLAIDPASAGVTLRRLFDNGVGNQRADVAVDGLPAGTWYTTGGNPAHRWREDDFDLPAAATAGKAKVQIEIHFVSSDIDWNEFEYRAFSRAP